jgi:hypothetical protein
LNDDLLTACGQTNLYGVAKKGADDMNKIYSVM